MNDTPIQRFRLASDLWQQLGDQVGDRARSGELQAFVEWRLANPDVPLPTEGEEVVDLLVRIRVGRDGRKAEVLPLPGSHSRTVTELRAEVIDAIVERFRESATAPVAAKPRRKTARKAAR